MRCVWMVQTPSVNNRFTLTSGLGGDDGIYVATYNYGNIGRQQKISIVGQNYTIPAHHLIITLSVGHSPTRGFSLSFFSSGLAFYDALTGYADLTTTSGNYVYPQNGENYKNNEDAVFFIVPAVPAQPTLRFIYVDLESDLNCVYDYVTIYTWFDNDYKQVARVCGETLPPTVTFVEGAGLVTFRSDGYMNRRGFKFEWA
ncbi:deleted in malignant brain tumors 1 protein-like [Folsomia candida]|nr:deleted in malignant brain tumors 1 protein-like [Folsomia candida]